MAPLRTTITALVIGASAVAGFAPQTPLTNLESVARPTTSSLDSTPDTGTTGTPPQPQQPWLAPSTTDKNKMFERGMEKFEEDYPGFAKWGWGPTVHAEKWNGRHAMFGWFFICCTSYFKGHGMIPDATQMLTFKDWGTLAVISGAGTKEAIFINQERAVILFANVHCFCVGLFATIAPLPWSDQLLLDPNQGKMYERAKNQKPYGLMPDMGFDKWGLTDTAEIMNGRMAMFGLIMLLGASLVDDKPMVDIVNQWIGGLYY